jgi:acetyl-CoA acetyltransferase
MTNAVRVVAAGIVPFAKFIDAGVDVIAARAIKNLVRDLPIDMPSLDEVYVGTSKGGSLIGQRALRFAGLANGQSVFNVENACASSAVAFNLAYRSIAAEQAETVLVIGVDRLSDLGRGALPVQATEWEGVAGVTNPVVYAMRARRYMHETGASVESLAEVSVKSRAFATQNPAAQMRTQTSVDEVLNSRPIADPLTMFQCSPKSDGSAALLLMSENASRRHGITGPLVRSSIVRSGRFSMSARDITRPDVTTRTVEAAFTAAGIGADELDVVELHDAFSIAELLYMEEIGLCAEGDAPEVLRSGATSSLRSGGTAVVNPSGGLLSRGHPIGATGAAQLVELTHQLTGRSGVRQRENARAALAHVTGGGASGFDNGACCVTVLTSN